MAITLLARGRAVEPPTIMVFVSLLFTLPTIRLAQPAVPKEAGCLSDVVSYFWAMTLMSFSAILMLTNYIHKYRAPNVQAPQTAAQKKDNRDINASLVVGASDDVEANAGAGMGGGGAGAAGGFDMQDAGGGGDDAGGGE
ncbi:hypothetical protein HK405_014277 [Cladochytrium tenue]|nr:hypothetical protein HK405_014277 [Cladochytrium tenue]